jgi:hypothetical protein
MKSLGMLKGISLALKRAQFGIKMVAIVYAIGLFAGGVMVHPNSGLALRFRARLVGDARQTSPY